MNNKQIEYIKCYKDKTRNYFIENYLSTFNADDGKETPFILFPRQKEFTKSLVNYLNTIAIKHRQAGITTVTSAWVTGQIVFAKKESPETVLCIGNKLDISDQLLEKMANFLDQVPRWFWGDEFYSPDPDSPKNKKSIYKSRNKHFIEVFNGCRIYARSSGENAARGISAVSILIFDEAAFIQNGIAVYSQAVAATASVKNSKIIMVSTPNGKDQLYYKTYSKALAKQNNYHPVEFKWYQDLRYNRNLKWVKKLENGEEDEIVETTIDNNGNIEYNEERWRKLEADGYKPISPWYIKMCLSFNNNERQIAQELDVSFLGSSDNVVSPEFIEYHRDHNVIEIDDDWKYHDKFYKDTWIWETPIENHRYVCCVDPSSGSGEDRTSIEIIDVDGVDENDIPCFKQVLEYNGKLIGNEVGELVNKYAISYNYAYTIVECIGGYGDSVVIELMKLGYPNLYYDDPKLKSYSSLKNDITTDEKLKESSLPGLRTNSLRIQMIDNFVTMIRENTFRIRSIRVINELDTWIFKNGRPDHMDGAHDDNLTCLSMGLFIITYYILKKEKQKNIDKTMIQSWLVNKYSDNKFEIHNEIEKNNFLINGNPKKFNPFYGYKTKEKTFKDHINGCLLLGGYKC